VPRIVAPRRGTGLALDGIEPLLLRSWDGGPAKLPTEVRVAHTGAALVVEFCGACDRLTVDPGLPTDRSVPGLWRFDVVEVFVSDRAEGVPYREIEATPLGQWLAIAFDRPRVEGTTWAARPRVEAEVEGKRFRVRLAMALAELRTRPGGGGREGAAGDGWRLGLFRIAGREPEREYSSLVPTLTSRPDFHQPSRWAWLTLGD